MVKRKDWNNALEQHSRGRVRTLLAEWVVNSLADEDYAFDYLIRPTNEGTEPSAVSPSPVFAQLKASREFDNAEYVWHDFDTDFLVDDCLESPVPVVLFVYERSGDELNWCIAQTYCWDVLDEEEFGWRDQSNIRVKLKRNPITSVDGRARLQEAVKNAQRRITTRDFVATSRDDPFEQLPGTPYPTAPEVMEYKEDLLRESTRLLEADQMEDAFTRLLEIYKLSDDEKPALKALRDLLTHQETDDPTIAFAKIRFANDGIRLAKKFERDELRERFESELEDAWNVVDEQFVGARYLHRESGLPMLVLGVSSRHIDDGGVVLTATVQWGGDIDMENAHAMTANDEFELLESGESRDLQADACAEQNHDFEKEALELSPLRAICSQCGLSGEAIQYLLNHDFPEVCDDCGAIDYDLVYEVEEDRRREIGRCPDCR